MSFSSLHIFLITIFQLFPGYLSDIKANEILSERAERSLVIFPSGSIFQMTLGISIASEVHPNNGQLNFGFQQNIKLPTNITELHSPPQPRSLQQLGIYEYLEKMIDSYGMNGQECLIKSICQMAKNPLEKGLLEDLITFILTPSLHIKDEKERKKTNDRLGEDYAHKDPYLFSEKYGKSQGNCSSAFLNCPQTPLDIISRLFIDP